MLITLVCFGLLAIGILIDIIEDRTHYSLPEWLGLYVASTCTLFGSMASLVCVILLMFTHIGVDYNIEKRRMEYQNLQNRCEVITSDYEDVSKSEVIKEIGEWDRMVYSNKYFSENPWTNWFYDKRYVDSLDYIMR